VSEKYRDFFSRIATQEGASCKLKPYMLSHPEIDVFPEQMVPEQHLPRLSFEHVCFYVTGPFPLRQVAPPTGQGRRGSNETTLSTTTTGSAYIGIVVDHFTKAAEFLLLYDKQAATVARAFHDNWLMR
jgi:hypothetical protein